MFRDPKTGVYYTKALFLEQSYSDKSNVIYTLKDTDHKGYKSLYRLYMELEDVTEFEFANLYLGGYEHWNMINSTYWGKPLAERWRKELELKLRARALANVISVSRDPEHKASYEANKFLLSGQWKEKSAVGRPSKEAIKAEAEKLFKADQEVIVDFERIKELN